MGVFEYLSPEYVKSKLDLLDISLSSLRDALRGTDSRTLTDLYTQLGNILSKLDVNLSTRAADSTLSSFSGKFPSAVTLADNLSNPSTTIIGAGNLGWDGTYWRRLSSDTSGRLRISADVVANPSNLDISLSALRDALRGTGNKTLTDLDTDLNTIISRLPTSLTTAGNFKIALLEDSVGILKDSKIPNALGVITNQDVIGNTINVLAVVDMLTPSRQPYTIANINVSTTEGSTSIASPGAKILMIKNKGDVDVQIGINGSVPTTNPFIVRARTIKVLPHKGVTQVNYKVTSGSSTIDIEYYN
jgi:hypothetical protein